MRFIQNIVFITVVIVILLHSMILHKHHGEMSFREHQLAHQKANTLFKVIGLAFHEGPSTNLDNYVLTEKTLINKTDIHQFSPCIYATLDNLKWLSILESKEQSLYKFSLTKSVHLQPHGLRGPPDHDFYA